MVEFLYKFACFDCKIAFKRKAIKVAGNDSAHLADSDIAHACPNCGHRMAFMGRNFSAPSMIDKNAWEAAKVLWEAGFRFSGNGYHTDPALPRSKSEVHIFIIENPNHEQKIGSVQKWESYA